MDLFGLLGLLEGLLGGIGQAMDQAADAEQRAKLHAVHLRSLRDLISSCEPCRGAINNGPVELQGRAVALGRWRSPVSGRATIGFRLRVEGHEPARPEAPPVSTILDTTMMQDFEIALPDQAGHVRVCAASRCLPLLQPEPTRSLALEDLMSPGYADLFDRVSLMASEAVSYRRFVVTEFLLEPDEPVFVFGLAYRQVDPRLPASGYRSVPERLLVGPTAEGLLVVADQDRDSLLRTLPDTVRTAIVLER